MGKVLILGGTSESVLVVNQLIERKKEVVVTTLTNWDMALPAGVKRITGGCTRDQLLKIIAQEKVNLLVDLTHPYACAVSKLITEVSQQTNLPLFTYIRPEYVPSGKNVFLVKDHLSALKLLFQFEETTLLTIGIKNLLHYKQLQQASFAYWIKLLAPSLGSALALGFDPKKILILPPRLSFNQWEELIHTKQIKVLVSKSSGEQGGVKEKFELARKYDLKFILIQRPVKPSGEKFFDLQMLIKRIVQDC